MAAIGRLGQLNARTLPTNSDYSIPFSSQQILQILVTTQYRVVHNRAYYVFGTIWGTVNTTDTTQYPLIHSKPTLTLLSTPLIHSKLTLALLSTFCFIVDSIPFTTVKFLFHSKSVLVNSRSSSTHIRSHWHYSVPFDSQQTDTTQYPLIYSRQHAMHYSDVFGS